LKAIARVVAGAGAKEESRRRVSVGFLVYHREQVAKRRPHSVESALALACFTPGNNEPK
jgi:hypothetical protein